MMKKSKVKLDKEFYKKTEVKELLKDLDKKEKEFQKIKIKK